MQVESREISYLWKSSYMVYLPHVWRWPPSASKISFLVTSLWPSYPWQQQILLKRGEQRKCWSRPCHNDRRFWQYSHINVKSYPSPPPHLLFTWKIVLLERRAIYISGMNGIFNPRWSWEFQVLNIFFLNFKVGHENYEALLWLQVSRHWVQPAFWS